MVGPLPVAATPFEPEPPPEPPLEPPVGFPTAPEVPPVVALPPPLPVDGAPRPEVSPPVVFELQEYAAVASALTKNPTLVKVFLVT